MPGVIASCILSRVFIGLIEGIRAVCPLSAHSRIVFFREVALVHGSARHKNTTAARGGTLRSGSLATAVAFHC